LARAYRAGAIPNGFQVGMQEIDDRSRAETRKDATAGQLEKGELSREPARPDLRLHVARFKQSQRSVASRRHKEPI